MNNVKVARNPYGFEVQAALALVDDKLLLLSPAGSDPPFRLS